MHIGLTINSITLILLECIAIGIECIMGFVGFCGIPMIIYMKKNTRF